MITNVSENTTYADFYLNHLLNNQLCTFDSWLTKDWLACSSWRNCDHDEDDGRIDLDNLFKYISDKKLCVADCSLIEFDTHPTQEISVNDFCVYWRNKIQGKDDRILYLKDWHYFKCNSESNYWFTLPKYFSSDWLNEFWEFRNDVTDDFKFVYLGSKGTWTPLHADVYRSYSWSANVVGHKRWWFFPPGEEKKLLLPNGKLPPDIRSITINKDVKYYVIDQYSGQVVFVPSGWYHQVVNMTDCISINHNWYNATNINYVWDHLKDQLEAVEESTKDVCSIPGWHEECQKCLRALAGINFKEFFALLKYILITRWPRIHPDDVNKFIKKCKSIQYTSLDDNVLDSVMDCELSALIETDSGIFYTALKNPDYWREYYAAHSVSETDDDTVKWIRVHDFCVVIQVIKQFVQHRIVKALKLCYSGVLQSFWDNF